jgi:CRP-like cAMP-binding protein
VTESFHLRQNWLLAALPDVDLLRLAPELDQVDLHQGEALYESGAPLSCVYFPTTALVSNVYEFEDGALAETAVVGNEGLVGIAVFMGGDSRLGRAVVLRAGNAFRMRAHAVKEEFQRAGPLMHLLLRYTQALITQIAQTAACNRHHSLDQRMCRWLLLSLDRLQGNDVGMTQELIANMLGVRREGVTAAAQQLQKLGLIHCSRGHIAVLDRRGLEQRACECYAVVRKEYERLLPHSGATPEPDIAGTQRGTAQPVPTGVFDSERTAIAQPPTLVVGQLDQRMRSSRPNRCHAEGCPGGAVGSTTARLRSSRAEPTLADTFEETP